MLPFHDEYDKHSYQTSLSIHGSCSKQVAQLACHGRRLGLSLMTITNYLQNKDSKAHWCEKGTPVSRLT